MKYDIVIGIDPDKDKSGFAFLEPKTQKIRIENLTFPNLLERLKSIKFEYVNEDCKNVIVVVEAGWLVHKSNFHKAQGHAAERIAKDVGANHETGRKIFEMCEHYQLNVVQIRPLRKCWKGHEGKITHEEISYFMPIKGRTNQDGRDAALIAWCYANLPIRVKPIERKPIKVIMK